MRALLLSEYKTLSVVDMPTPEIGDDDVLVVGEAEAANGTNALAIARMAGVPV